MHVGLIRLVETRTVEIPDGDLPAQAAAMDAACPPGWEVASIPKRLLRRVDETREVEADDMPALEALVPEGWELLSVRKV